MAAMQETPSSVPQHATRVNIFLAGGALVFCTAVLVQLLQVSSLTLPLWVALSAAAIAIPFLSGAVWIFVSYEHLSNPVATIPAVLLLILGLIAAACVTISVFWHFSLTLGVVTILSSVLALVLVFSDGGQQTLANPPPAP